MPAYQVFAETTIREVYQVEADSAEEAIAKVRDGDWTEPPKPDRLETIEIDPEYAERSMVS